jgi:hypothetical protein
MAKKEDAELTARYADMLSAMGSRPRGLKSWCSCEVDAALPGIHTFQCRPKRGKLPRLRGQKNPNGEYSLGRSRTGSLD